MLQGDQLEIEFRDGAKEHVSVHPGQVDWDEPTERPHRARNVGATYEEITVFFLDRPGAIHQPKV